MVHVARHAMSGALVRIHEQDGLIQSVEPAAGNGDGLWIAPGFIDIQVNGFAGVDFNSPATPSDEIARSIDAIRATGATRFFPTVITASRESMCASLRNLARAKSMLAGGGAIAGFHVEGPWISRDSGPLGAHPREHVRPSAVEEYKAFQDAAEGHIRLVTLAPEAEGALALIEHLTTEGVAVSIGHTGADSTQIRDAIAAGASLSTHLGNAAPSQLPRKENLILAQLAARELAASFIVDDFHLAPEFLQVAVRAKGVDRTILVTDAVPPAGCAPGNYRCGPLEVELTPGGRVELTSTRRLAGSALRMDEAIGNLMRIAGLSLADAIKAATVNPARALNMEGRNGILEAGEQADLVFFRIDDASGAIRVEKVLAAAT